MLRRPFHLLLILLVVGSGCEGPPRAIPCALPADPTQFGSCAQGSGVFGTWVVDEHGLPAYAYDFDDVHDPRGVWELSDGSHRITMESTDGSGLNMDQLVLMPVQ